MSTSNVGRCVHCLAATTDLTSDHIFPAAWYPDTTPANLEKWRAPSCRKCNADYGKLEENLLIRFGMCLDRDAPGSSGIATRVLNALNPARGRNSKDAEIRLKKALGLLAQSQAITPETPAIIVNSGPASDGVVVANADLKRFGEKVVRGLIWIYLQRLVDESYQLKVWTRQDLVPAFDSEVKECGQRYDRGPGIEVWWARYVDDPVGGTFLIILFGRILLRAAVMPRSAISQSSQAVPPPPTSADREPV